jgi:phosphoglycolate phosphatase-like HAD superfamily hydrolase
MIYIFDLDGTIANLDHRLHFIGASHTNFVDAKDTPDKDWAGFLAAAADDSPYYDVITIARALSRAGHTNVISTGRPDDGAKITTDWLGKYRVPFDTIFMRKAEDHREDFVVKEELLARIMEQYNVANPKDLGGAFEDRQQVTDMYRRNGVRCFQVAPGKF